MSFFNKKIFIIYLIWLKLIQIVSYIIYLLYLIKYNHIKYNQEIIINQKNYVLNQL
jgi:hypothetical protein